MSRLISDKFRLEVFMSPGFVMALLLLLLNDYYLKYEFSNWFTGKLSDFSGLFIFALFWSAFFPRRNKLIIIATAILFAVWKSPYSQYIIEVWNEFTQMHISRVVDYSDLTALAVLPISRIYFLSLKNVSYRRAAAYPIMVLAIFSIMGTSVMRPYYVVDFEMQKRDYQRIAPSADYSAEDLGSDVNARVNAVAEKNGLECMKNCVSGGLYRLYEGGSIRLQTNYDVVTNTIFASILTYDPVNDEEAVERLGEELLSVLETDFRNLTVETSSWGKNYNKNDLVRSVKVKISLKKIPFTSWCKAIEGNSELMLAHKLVDEFIDRNIRVLGYDDVTYLKCYMHDSRDYCRQRLCDAYEYGRVIGVKELERANSLRVDFKTTVFGSEFVVDIIERADDDSADNDALVRELEKTLRDALQEDTVIEVLKSERR